MKCVVQCWPRMVSVNKTRSAEFKDTPLRVPTSEDKD